MYKVRISEQVERFLQSLAPTPKLRLREAMGQLARHKGDIKALENDLSGFSRLKVGRYRVVFCYAEPSTIDCVFAEERKLVYEVFAALLREQFET
jgi:mRNA interferase RelE/StbE